MAVRAYRTLDGECKTLGWLIGERPGYGQKGDWKYYFSDFPADAPLERLVEYVHRRCHIDRFYEDAKMGRLSRKEVDSLASPHHHCDADILLPGLVGVEPSAVCPWLPGSSPGSLFVTKGWKASTHSGDPSASH